MSTTTQHPQDTIPEKEPPQAFTGETNAESATITGGPANETANIGADNKSTPTVEIEQDKKNQDESKYQRNTHGLKYKNIGLWEQIFKYTRPVDIDDEFEFFWPESRKSTEEVVSQLAARHILFIRSASEDWLYLAVQRLACIIHTCGKFEKPLTRITRVIQDADSNDNGQLPFGFWDNQRCLTSPVIIFISANRYDFLQKFLNQRKETITEFIRDLKNLNLYIVCQVEDNVPNRELFTAAKPWIYNVYAFWDLPVVKLQLLKDFNAEGMELYQQLRDQLIDRNDERRIFDELINRHYKTSKEVLENLTVHLADTLTNIDAKQQQLEQFLEEDDFIKKLVVFCGAHFDGLYYPDFYKLIRRLLEEEYEEPLPVQPATAKQDQLAQPVPLGEKWMKNADRYLKTCYLKIIREGGNRKVEFDAPRLAVILTQYISDNYYPLFYRVYRKFNQVGFLTDIGISEKMETYCLRFFALAARTDTHTHDAYWLKELVHRLWMEYEKDLPDELKSYDEVISYLKRKRFFATLITSRIPLFISGLLLNSKEEYHEIIREFFRLLLNEKDAKKMAIIIASYLYQEYRFTDTFSTDDLMGYFRRTLEEGNWDESFFGYDALRDKMDYNELYTQTNAWISNKDISSTSWTAHFAHLYQLDYILETLYRYFNQHKGEGNFELLEGATEEGLPAAFTDLVKRLLGKPSLNSLQVILENEHNEQRFKQLVQYFEGIASEFFVVVSTRIEPPNNTAVSLVADALESLFFALTHKHGKLKPNSPVEERWRQYASLVINAAGDKLMVTLKKCWTVKLQNYSFVTQKAAAEKWKDDDKLKMYVELIQKKIASLHMFIQLLNNTKSNNSSH